MTSITGDPLSYFVSEEPEAFNSITIMYNELLGGIPSKNGYETLVWRVLDTNYGYSEGYNYGLREFNQENAFINIANSLIGGNDEAAETFTSWLGNTTTLKGQVEALYRKLIAPTAQNREGIDWLTRPEALAFYEGVALERGVGGEHAAAIAALGSIATIAIQSEVGIGDTLHDLRNAILDGSYVLPETSTDLLDPEIADGVNYDGNDSANVYSGVDFGW